MEYYRKILNDLVKFKSISTDSSYRNQIDDCVDYLQDLLEENEFEVNIIPGYDNPILLASKVIDPEYKTCLIYGHYDVQPADVEGWFNDPFSLLEKDGRLYARGVLDNKGQFLIHLVSIIELITSKNLKYNIKIMLEGNEETGSDMLEKFFTDYKDALKSDLVMISDGEISKNTPIIEVGFRGVVNCTLEVTSSYTDLHSGIFGGAATDAGKELTILLSKIYDKNGSLSIKDMEIDIPQKMRDECEKIDFDEEEYKRVSGTKSFDKKENYFVLTGLMPAITITGIDFGYNGEGYRNAIAHKAIAKINIRTSPLQNPTEIGEIFKKWVEKNISKNVDYKLVVEQISSGAVVDIANKYVKKADEILTEVYGVKPYKKYSGGTLPIASMIQRELSIPQLYIPFGNEDCNMHGTNENFVVSNVEKGIEFSKKFFSTEIK